MGAEEALLFAREGAKVVIGDVLEEGRDVAAQIPAGQAIFVRLDVTKEDDCSGRCRWPRMSTSDWISWSTTRG